MARKRKETKRKNAAPPGCNPYNTVQKSTGGKPKETYNRPVAYQSEKYGASEQERNVDQGIRYNERKCGI
jgi:hypothetical protein